MCLSRPSLWDFIVVHICQYGWRTESTQLDRKGQVLLFNMCAYDVTGQPACVVVVILLDRAIAFVMCPLAQIPYL